MNCDDEEDDDGGSEGMCEGRRDLLSVFVR